MPEDTSWRAIFKILKPCPFCGMAPGFYKVGDWFSIRCGTCGLKIEKHQLPTEIARLWNTRVCNCGSATQNAQPDLFEATFGK